MEIEFLFYTNTSVHSFVKARLHRRFLLQQLKAIFVVPKLQLQNSKENKLQYKINTVSTSKRSRVYKERMYRSALLVT